jgi:hypothetical protein
LQAVRRPWLLLFGLAAAFIETPAIAEGGAEGLLSPVDVHAFVSQGFIYTTHGNNYLSADTTHGSFQFSEAGINFSKGLADKLRVGVQLFAENIGPTGSYDVRLDWAYLDYRWRDWLGFRAGRVKIPFGLYNEYNDVDSARVPVLLPQSVYPLQNRNFLLAQTGAELYGYIRAKSAGALEYRAYAGTIFLDTTTPPGSPYQIEAFNVPFVLGGRLMWETPAEGLRVGGSLQTLRLDATFLGNMAQAKVEIPAVLWVGSVEYAAGNFLGAAEYSRWYAKADSSAATIFPSSPTVISERAYVMASYRVSKWLQPGAYYSALFPDADNRDGRARRQYDLATTLRFDINSHWLFKVEGHFMAGTAGLSPGLNGNTSLAALDRYWAAFFAKTTAYF